MMGVKEMSFECRRWMNCVKKRAVPCFDFSTSYYRRVANWLVSQLISRMVLIYSCRMHLIQAFTSFSTPRLDEHY
jgi:hypothetical protein